MSSLQITTDWRRICINEIIRFIKTSTSLHTKIAAEMNSADGQLVRVKESGEEILSLRGRSRIQVTSKEDEQPQRNGKVN